jgi:hypothetical protein
MTTMDILMIYVPMVVSRARRSVVASRRRRSDTRPTPMPRGRHACLTSPPRHPSTPHATPTLHPSPPSPSPHTPLPLLSASARQSPCLTQHPQSFPHSALPFRGLRQPLPLLSLQPSQRRGPRRPALRPQLVRSAVMMVNGAVCWVRRPRQLSPPAWPPPSSVAPPLASPAKGAPTHRHHHPPSLPLPPHCSLLARRWFSPSRRPPSPRSPLQALTLR